MNLAFRHVGESRYQLAIEACGVTLDVDRLRRERHELVGELAVTCTLAGAHAVTDDGLIHLADFNLSSAQARTARAKLLRDRSEAELDWATWLEHLCLQTIRAERTGTPARALHQFERRIESPSWNLHGWCLPRHHPAILFGDGGSLKSYLALYAAGRIAEQGISVLWCDWELDFEHQGERLHELFGPDLPTIHYLRCDRPLIDEAGRIRREVGRLAVEYAVFDSVGFAVPGPPESAEMATGYFRAVRQIACPGSLHLAHANRNTTDDKRFKGLKPFGSIYWHNSARSTWFVRRTDEDGTEDQPVIGVYNQKMNLARLAPAVGFRFFSPGHPVQGADLADMSDLSLGLSLRQRIAGALKGGPLTIVAIAKTLDAKTDSVEKSLKHGEGKAFLRLVQNTDGIHRWALKQTA